MADSFMRKWIFSVETSQGGGYLLETGALVTDRERCKIFIGTDNQADKEAIRRAAAFGDLTGGRVDRVFYESQGKLASRDLVV